MTSDQEIQDSAKRLRKLLMVFACGLAVLVVTLFYVQIVRGAFYDQRLRQQSLRSVKLPPPRGRIFDRNGVCMADNRPSYGVALYLQELRRQSSRRRPRLQVAVETAGTLSRALGLPAVSEDAIRTHLNQKPAVPMKLWGDLGPDKIAVFAEQVSTMPGVEIVVSSTRVYPLGMRATHVLGHLGRKEDTDDDERRGYYLQPEMVGKTGMEAVLDASLRGEPGGRIVQLDVLGYSENVFSEIKPEPGADAVLTIDARLQQLVESALASAPMPAGRPVRGAAVLVDVTNGDVLAMASFPTFDSNLFARGISRAEYERLDRDPGKPFLNRAVQGLKPPGSVFKPFVALAGLESGVITQATTAECPGFIRLGNQTMRCWAENGHGHVGIVDAMRVSCDVFFYQNGIKMGVRPIKQMSDAFGFGAATGVPLAESKGFIPTEEWLWTKYRQRWTDGRTANMAIGQGEVLVTPLQMAMATAAIANSGILWQPRLALRLESGNSSPQVFAPKLRSRIPVSAEHLELVRRMMLEVVESAGGTGGRARVAGVKIAGKTGTAEVGPPNARRNVAWFTAFAPYEQPRYALAIMIEDGDHGGTTAGPVAGKILAGLFGSRHSEETGGTAGD